MNLDKTPHTSENSLTTFNNSVVASIKDLNQQELETVDIIQKSINIKDTTSTITFGTQAQEDITKFTDTILSTVKAKDLSGAGENLQKMIDEMKSIDFSSIKASDGFLANLPVIGDWMKKGLRSYLGDFETVSDKISGMLKTLDGQKNVIVHDIDVLDKLYASNLTFVRNLELFIFAGTQKLVEFETEAARLQQLARETQDPLDAQNYSDFQKSIGRFEKRITNLKSSRLVAIQAAGQIRLAQESDKMIVEDIIDVIHNTVPMWKRQFIIAISLSKQEKALQISTTVKDYTNLQYKDNATKLSNLVDEVSASFERGILDVSTMKEVNQLTIDTIKKSLDVYKNAKVKRIEVEKELVAMENDLKTSLLEASNINNL